MYELTHHDLGTIQQVAHSLTLEEGIDALRRISRVYMYREICCNEESAKPMPFRNLLHVPQHRSVLMTHLDPIWFRGGRCSRKQADSIAAQIRLTQQRNVRAMCSHRKITLQRLHALDIYLTHIRKCCWPP